MGKPGKPGRRSKAQTMSLQSQIMSDLDAGKSLSETVAERGVSRQTVWRHLRKLTATLEQNNVESFQELRKTQVGTLLDMARAVASGKVTPEIANSFNYVMKHVTDILGLRAPTRTISTKVTVGNETTRGFYVEFARRTMKLKHPESWARLWAFIDSMPDDYVKAPPQIEAEVSHEDVQ